MGLFDGLFGGGGDSNVTQTQRFEPPYWTQSDAYPYWSDLVNNAIGLGQLPQQQFNGPSVAPLPDQTLAAINMASDRAINGAPDLNAARGSVANIATGGMFANPALGSNVTSDRNPYAGQNQYLQNMIDSSNYDIINGFRTGTAAQTDSAAALAGSFGGGGWIAQQAANAGQLGRSLANNENQYRFQDYTTQQGLAENAINRDTANQQFNIGQQSGAWNQGVGNMLNAANLTGSLSQDDWKSIEALGGAGEGLRNYTQQLYDANRQSFDEQQNAPWLQMDRIMNVLSRASGQGGSNTSSIQQPPLSVVGNLLGTAGGLYGLSMLGGAK